jgi:lipopolysaccharide export system protein LptA
MINRAHVQIFVALFIATFTRASDTLLHLVHADKSFGKIINGERVHISSGNVEAYQDTLKMFCDELIFYEGKERADFIGNVMLYDGHRRIWADNIIYYTDKRTAHCKGHVQISGVNDSLYADEFIYMFREGNATGNSSLFLWDKENNARVWGDYGNYIAAERYSLIKGNARFEHYDTDASDTLIITSKEMEYYGDEPKRAIALDSVRIFRGDIKALCDSATYLVTDEKVSLRINPLAWQQENEMSGSEINLALDSLEINEIFIHEKAHMKSLVDTLEEKYNHIRGKSIQVSLMERRPYRIIARNNATSLYALKDDSLNQGTNFSSSDSIIIFFKQGEVDSISILGGIEGIFYPPDYKGEIKGEY